MALDPRTNAFRADLADASLRNVVKAEKFVDPVLRQCLSGVLQVRSTPDPKAGLITEVRYGEFLDVFEIREDGFIWAQNRFDRYVGYIFLKDALGDQIAMMSNRVTALKTFVYPKPDMKTPPIDELTLGSYASIVSQQGDFLELTNGGFVYASHVQATEYAETRDYVFTAGRLLHTPYLWGGRTPKGIDCSAFVQLALEMAGIDMPRDSDQQREAFGKPLETHWRDRAWKRGDLVFFPGHVGIMTGGEDIIHASTRWMEVIVEPLADVVARGREVVAATDAQDLLF